MKHNVRESGQFLEKKLRQGRKSANFLELKNRFETLTKGPSKDNLTSKANDKAKQATKPISKTKQTNKKVLLLADSNGRGCSAKLKEKKLAENFEVTSFVKPNGKLELLIESIAPLTKNFNENDCVIILGRTNDVGINENYNLNLKPAVKTFLETTKNTNVILNAIPKRFDNERLNFETSRANKQIL